MAELITLDNVSYQVKNKLILDRITLTIQENDIITIIGPNGAGKSSLLRVIAGLEKPSSGALQYRGHSSTSHIQFGFMPQQLKLNALLPIDTEAFLSLGTKPHSDKEKRELFEQLNINKLLNTSMHDLSGGEKQRVLLARAILQKPDCLILDEPAQGVDITGQNRLYDLISQMQQQLQCAVIMVSHDLHYVMAQSNKVICLNQHICCQGHPENISTDQSFLKLFDQEQLSAIGHYTHHHDHHHDLHGQIVEGEHGAGCQHDH